MLKPILLLARRWKLLSFRKILYLPHILNPFEKGFLVFLLVLVFSSLGTLVVKNYLKLTVAIPDEGGTYIEGMLKEPRYVNPVYASTDGDRDISRLVFSGLIFYSGSGEIKNDLAEKVEIEKPGKTYTVFLKQGVFWHDGNKLTADDIVFTIKLIQNPQYKSPLRSDWQGVSVEKIDDYTVKFSLRAPYAHFLENLTVGIIPQHLWEKIGPEQALLHELNLKPVGSGPYIFNSLEQNSDGIIQQYVLKRNPKYYGEGPYIKTIKFVFFKTAEELLTGWRKAKVDGFGPVDSDTLKKAEEQKVIVNKITMPRIFGLFFNNQASSPLADKNLRKAVALAIDKKTASILASSGGVTQNDSFLPAGSLGYTNDLIKYEFNPEAARSLLEKEGWRDENGDGVREKKKIEKKKEMVQPLKFKLVTSDWPDLVKIAELIREELRAVGIEVALEIKNFAELDASAIRPRNFDMLLFGQVYGYEPDPFSFWHSSQARDPGLNVAMYSNKKVDKLLEEARQTLDKDARAKKYEEAQRIVAEDIPAVFLYSQLYPYLLSTKIKGAELSKISLPADRFNEINKWYIDTKRVLK